MNNALIGLIRSKMLADNYRPILLGAAFFIISTCAFAQYDSTRAMQSVGAYGYSYKNLRILDASIIPTDTLKLSYLDYGGIAYKNGSLYVYNGQYWVKPTGAVTPAMLALKVNYSDTASMLVAYQNAINQINLNGVLLTQSITATSGQIDFIFSGVPTNYNNYQIYKNGVKVLPSVDYTTSANDVNIPNAVSTDVITYQRIKNSNQ